MGLKNLLRCWEDPSLLLRRHYSLNKIRQLIWGQIVSPEHRYFMDELRDDVSTKANKDVLAWLNPSNEPAQELMHFRDDCHYDTFRAHLLCAAKAIEHGADPGLLDDNELSPIAGQVGLPLGLMRDLSHEFGTCRQRSCESSVAAPIALTPRRGGALPSPAEAVLAQLRFERVLGGTGDVYVTPQQAFLRLSQGFDCIWREVPEHVRGLLAERKEMPCVDFDVRIRIEHLDEEERLINEELQGRSASGAAAWGLYFALTRKVPDDGIVVLTEVDKDGDLRGVDGVKEKVRALIQVAPPPDTIVVATEADENAANQALVEARMAGKIDVRRP